jgi:peptidoglycan-N-acetylglucosamine deacetylase
MSQRVTLTFDNGPTPGITERVLETLAERSVKATFFVVGDQLAIPGARALCERAAAEGHWIGNHTMTHTEQFGDVDDPGYAAREIGDAQAALGPLVHPDRLFRPYGDGVISQRLLSQPAVEYLTTGGYTCVLWNSVPHDWELPEEWVEACLADIETRPWSLVVMHDQDTGAMDHLARFIDDARTRDFQFVQDFPRECVPIERGELTGPITELLAA